MSLSPTHSLISLATLFACIGSIASADELGLSDLRKRLAALHSKNEASSDVQMVSYLNGENGASHLPAPDDLSDPAGGPPLITDQICCCNEGDGECDPIHGVYFAEVQFMWLRAHVTENAIGKLSEEYKLSPRFIIGYENADRVGGRIRYWHYDELTPNLTVPADAIRFELDVVDIEGTGRFGTDRSELVVAGGFRWTDARITLGDDAVANDIPGITFAADLRTIICRSNHWEWASVGGARWSLLGGDWAGSPDGFLAPNRDDNITVIEIYGGFEYIQHYSGYDVFARIAFEVQNWQSDVASQTAGADSINFMGPGLHLGLIF